MKIAKLNEFLVFKYKHSYFFITNFHWANGELDNYSGSSANQYVDKFKLNI